MVLLTSSAISAAISGAVVCAFTFLLFLCGYVLQQQSVRDLQYTLKNPSAQQWHYPSKNKDHFQQIQLEEDIYPAEPPVWVGSTEESISQIQDLDTAEAFNASASDESTENVRSREPSPRQLWLAYIDASGSNGDDVTGSNKPSFRKSGMVNTRERHAYILTISKPSETCAAAAFVRWYQQQSTLATKPSIIFIYPASWEVSDIDVHLSALDLIRDMQDNYNVICHPTTISKVWAGVDIGTQLLSELQRTRWSYDRAMYLRSPGMAIDVAALDSALATSNINRDWHRITQKSTGPKPSLLLYARQQGLLVPALDMKMVTSLASPFQSLDMMMDARHAAYVIFNENELKHKLEEHSPSNGIFERFEKGRQLACAGTSLLEENPA